MCVGIDGKHLDSDRQRQMVCYREVARARLDINSAVMLELNEHRMKAGWLRGEVKADHRLNRLLFTRWLQVQIENQVRAGIQPPAHVVRLWLQQRARLPKEEV